MKIPREELAKIDLCAAVDARLAPVRWVDVWNNIDHPDIGRTALSISVWCRSEDGAQEWLVTTEPDVGQGAAESIPLSAAVLAGTSPQDEPLAGFDEPAYVEGIRLGADWKDEQCWILGERVAVKARTWEHRKAIFAEVGGHFVSAWSAGHFVTGDFWIEDLSSELKDLAVSKSEALR